MFNYLFWILAGFCLGGVLFSYILPKRIKNIDIVKESKDHNPGTANAFLYAGIPVGILCLICDLGKGFLPVFMAGRQLSWGQPLFAFVVAAPVLGHVWGPWNSNISGKGIAVSFGVLLGLLPSVKLSLVLAIIYLICLLIFQLKPNEKCTVVTFVLFALTAMVWGVVVRQLVVPFSCLIISVPVIVKNLDFLSGEKETTSSFTDES